MWKDGGNNHLDRVPGIVSRLEKWPRHQVAYREGQRKRWVICGRTEPKMPEGDRLVIWELCQKLRGVDNE